MPFDKFGAFVGETDIDMEFLERAIHRDFIVVERGALQSASLAGLLNDAPDSWSRSPDRPERLAR